jgi:hypothetical protein
VLAEMGALCGREPVATLAVKDSDIERGRYESALREFAAALGRRS